MHPQDYSLLSSSVTRFVATDFYYLSHEPSLIPLEGQRPWVSLSVYQTVWARWFFCPSRFNLCRQWQLTVPWCIMQTWRVTHHPLALVRDVSHVVELYILANYWMGFWVLKSGVSWAGNLRWFPRAIFENVFLSSGASQTWGHLFQFSVDTESLVRMQMG